MQRERMLPGEAYVPSLREYTLRYGVTPARLRPGQFVMHPGPMNRGVEISDEVADSAASLITRQVRAGLVVRMAVLYDLLAGRRGGGVSGREARDGSMQAPGRAADVLVRGARVLDPGEGIDARLDVLVRAGDDRRRSATRSRRRRAPRSSRPRAARCCPRSSTRTCTCARPARSTRRISRPARPPRRRAATAACSRCRTPTRWWTRRRCSTRCTSARRSMRACASASWPRSRSGQHGEQLAPLGELADHGACGYSDDGRPVLSASLLRRALQYAATTGRVLSLHCEDTSLSRAADMHEGAVCARLGLVGYPAIAESTMIARDLRIAQYESRPLHICHLHVEQSVEEVRLARAGASTCPPRPRLTTCS